jgi:hypothetical protein
MVESPDIQILMGAVPAPLSASVAWVSAINVSVVSNEVSRVPIESLAIDVSATWVSALAESVATAESNGTSESASVESGNTFVPLSGDNVLVESASLDVSTTEVEVLSWAPTAESTASVDGASADVEPFVEQAPMATSAPKMEIENEDCWVGMQTPRRK